MIAAIYARQRGWFWVVGVAFVLAFSGLWCLLKPSGTTDRIAFLNLVVVALTGWWFSGTRGKRGSCAALRCAKRTCRFALSSHLSTSR
jgi:hypothetical protein